MEKVRMVCDKCGIHELLYDFIGMRKLCSSCWDTLKAQASKPKLTVAPIAKALRSKLG